jgi:very-short-patch-repair endonuclease
MTAAEQEALRRVVSGKLRDLQNELLDLSRRNRLLNFRAGKGAGSIRIVGTLPAEAFRLLVVEHRPLHFLPREEAPREVIGAYPAENDTDDGMGLSLAPLETDAAAERHKDTALKTTLPGETLHTRLTRLAQQARSAQEEQGSNILYLGLGIVSWRETPSSDVVSNAPLLLVPVELDRKSVTSRYFLRLLDEEIVANPCLLELSKRVFETALPAPDLTDEFDLKSYFGAVESAASPLGWEVAGEIHLGLFSFSKLLMYRDLDPETWPDHASIVDHPIVRQLLGFESPEPSDTVQERTAPELDESLHPSQVFQVMDADSSQQVAIAATSDGASAVIEGPPGTGKSQTITNIIAECLTRGRRVLFVAEKAAALEVVKKRLGEVGLHDFVLELHSRKTSKASVLTELQRCLRPPESPLTTPDVDPDELARLRTRANAYVREVHLIRSPLDLSAYDAMSRIATSPHDVRPDFGVPDIRSWSKAMFGSAREQIRSFDARLGRIGEPASHPWRAVGLTRLGSEAKRDLLARLETVRTALVALGRSTAPLADLLGRANPKSLRGIEPLIACAEVLGQTPAGISTTNWSDARWEGEALDTLLADAAARLALRPQWQKVFSPSAETEDWADVLARRTEGPGYFRWLGAIWRGDTRRLRAAAAGDLPARKALLEPLSALAKSAALRTGIEKTEQLYSDLLAAVWSGVDGDWGVVETAIRGARKVRRLAAETKLDAQVVERCLSDRAGLLRGREQVLDNVRAFRSTWTEWIEVTASSEAAWLGQTIVSDADFERLGVALEVLSRRVLELDDWVAYESIRKQLAGGPLAAAVVWAASSGAREARGRLEGLFERRFYELWAESVIDETPILSEFRGEEHSVTLERFKELDRLWIEATQARVAHTLRAGRPELTGRSRRGSKIAILEAEIRKKRRHLPLRRLFREAGEVVQAIKPCFMMSPISAAQYLAPGAVAFDVVIFDEASQVEPADAFGAIARARQVVLVGDEKQLPPTTFFKKVEIEGPPSGDEDDAASDVGKDMESILGLGMVQLPRRFSLRWHYRSRHESLISFSNEMFYDNLLRVFPSAHTGRDELGVQFRFVGGRYLRGAGQTNPDEARAVVDAIVAHAHQYSERTLGVGTFNLPQQLAILDELERRRRGTRDEGLEAFLTKEGPEPFFVKNLETIQGDERDVIFLSVTYGPDSTGRLIRNFGPLNREGGWRRLNVLVTRARQRCVVFSSLRADEIALLENAPRGVVALKEYLHFAEHGALSPSAVPAGGFDSPFEEDVANALRGARWEVHSQVGVAGFWVDLAIVDPERRGRYMVGVECDGATYHSSPTARDRDRLRQDVLEGLGWRLVRVWSTDWFKNREKALERLIAAIEEIRSGAPPARRATVSMRRVVPTALHAAEQMAAYGSSAVGG